MTDTSSSTANSNANDTQIKPKIAIIGGGLTGLFTATLLEREFAQQTNLPQITIFEKSRSVGRLATRYRTDKKTNKNWQWAFGAQFFTAKSASFSRFIQPWLESGLLEPWRAKVVDLTPSSINNQTPDISYKEQWDEVHARYISTPKMTSWGRALADNLHHTTINFKTRVAPLAQNVKPQYAQQKNAWHQANKPTELFDENGESLGTFDWVICTAPNGQALDLMAGSSFTEQAKITQPQMLACYTLMLGWDNIEKIPHTINSQTDSSWDVAYLHGSILGRVFIEHQKPTGNDLLPSVTIHARNDWSEQYVDDDIVTLQIQLLAAAKQALNWSTETAPSQVDCHRWRYASTVIDTKNDESNDSSEPLGILVDEGHQWIVSGDWCGQGNIESCYQMAEETVSAISKAMLVS